jgi:glucose/arabinose dehydrogenase
MHAAAGSRRLAAFATAIAASGLLAIPSAYALAGRVVATGFDQPTFVAAPRGDTRLFVVEKTGRIRLMKNGVVSTFLDLSASVATDGERGLLGLAFDPQYATNGRFYVDYVDRTTLQTKIARYRVSSLTPDLADPASRQEIIAIDQEPYTNHKGGWIAFRGTDRRHLYIAMGDGGSGYDPHDNAQNGQVLLGKMLRIDVSGTKAGYRIPADNPFVNSGTVRGEIWALGLRNPFRDSFDRKTGDFWIADVGQDTREEIDFEAAGFAGGRNYGWRLREGKIATPGGVGGTKPGLTDPVYDYPHTGTTSLGECVIGGYVYRGPGIAGANGRYFFGDCVSNRAFEYQFNADGTPVSVTDVTSSLIAGTGLTTLSSFGEDGQGRLYVVGQSGVLVVMCASPAAVDPATGMPPSARAASPGADGASPVRVLRPAAAPCQ